MSVVGRSELSTSRTLKKSANMKEVEAQAFSARCGLARDKARLGAPGLGG